MLNFQQGPVISIVSAIFKTLSTLKDLEGRDNSLSAAEIEIVRAGLSEILRSKNFSRAKQLKRLLEYLVTKAIQGEHIRIKEYTLAIEVFDRAEDVDIRRDSIVRVQASRLRSKLQKYYQYGKRDPVHINIPTGAYIPLFTFGSNPAPPSRPTCRRRPSDIQTEVSTYFRIRI